MTVKILLPAYGKHGCAVVAQDGQLRVVDPPASSCHGYTSGCVCEDCMKRAQVAEAKRNPVAPVAQACECDRPFGLVEGDCAKCGRAIPGERPARKAA